MPKRIGTEVFGYFLGEDDGINGGIFDDEGLVRVLPRPPDSEPQEETPVSSARIYEFKPKTGVKLAVGALALGFATGAVRSLRHH